MNAEALRTLYLEQLHNDLKPPISPHVDTRTTRGMLRHTARMPGGTLQPPGFGRTWIWSDLHIGHHDIIWHSKRPFADVRHMDNALMSAWKKTVSEEDTVICLGDLAVPAGFRGYRLNCFDTVPGGKILVFGNHDIDYTGAVCNPGFDNVHPTLYVDSDPPLLLTHMPLERLPDGFINVHGHTHNNLAPLSPFHINVCVEQLRYRPVDLNRVLALARALLAGARPLEETTAEQIDAIAGPGA